MKGHARMDGWMDGWMDGGWVGGNGRVVVGMREWGSGARMRRKKEGESEGGSVSRVSTKWF